MRTYARTNSLTYHSNQFNDNTTNAIRNSFIQWKCISFSKRNNQLKLEMTEYDSHSRDAVQIDTVDKSSKLHYCAALF